MRCLSYSSLATRRLILLLLLSLLSATRCASVTIDFRTSKCNNDSTYTANSTYSTNLDWVMDSLDTVMSNLILNNLPSGFCNSSHGESPDKVYGLLQCIGPISAQDCSNCTRQAKSRLETYCPHSIGGQVWMTYCYLRYDNSSFFSELNTAGQYLINTQDVTNGAEAFMSVKFDLLSNLSKIAPSAASKGFAIGNATYSPSNYVYGSVQCLTDISMDNCTTCLTAAIQGLESCCSRAQGAQAMLGSCTARYEIYPFYEPAMSSSSPEGSPTPNSSPPANTPAIGTRPLSKGNKKPLKIVSIILGTIAGVILFVVVCLLREKLKSPIFGEPVTAITHREETQGAETRLLSEEHIFLFGLETLIEATQSFHPHNKLGEGGFGDVYRGTPKDGNDIAVKKLSAKSSQGKNEFMNEVNLVASIQHRNLVKLLGCCVEKDERLLVYEYLPNKSLDNFIFDSQLRIIHRDVKAQNILLDEKLNPKIGDFGLARLFPEDATHIQTRVAGTYGYMAPDYAMRGQLSVKADVYSFGVLLLEIVSGRKNTENHLPQEMQNLLEWAWRLFKRGDVLNMVDSMIIQNCREEQAQRCIHVGLLCVQADASLRPAISNVLMMISSNAVTLPNPAQPAFVSQSPNPESRLPSSVNNTSISEVKPR